MSTLSTAPITEHEVEQAEYVALPPGWPDDPDTVAEAHEHAEGFAGKGALTIDNGRREVAETALAFVRRFA
jgi:hypothetical protein